MNKYISYVTSRNYVIMQFITVNSSFKFNTYLAFDESNIVDIAIENWIISFMSIIQSNWI